MRPLPDAVPRLSGLSPAELHAEILRRIEAYDIDGEPREGAWLAEVTDLVDLSKWPEGSRVIVGRERPHPGAQLRFTDADGHRFTAFLTDTPGGQTRLAAKPRQGRFRRPVALPVRMRSSTPAWER